MMLSGTPDSASVRELLVFYYRYRKRLMAAFLIPFVLAVGISFIPKPRYPAAGVLVVRMGSEYVYQPETGSAQTGPQTSIPFDRDQIYKAEVAILNSDDLHQRVIEAIGAQTLYPELFTPSMIGSVIDPVLNFPHHMMEQWGWIEPPTEEEIARARMSACIAIFDKRLDINLEKESAVITVTFEHKDSDIAAKTVATLFDLYLEKRKNLYLEPRVGSAQSQANAAKGNAVAAAKAIEQFKIDNKIYSLADERASLIQQRDMLQRQRMAVSSSILDEKIALYNQQLERLDKLDEQLGRLEHDATVANDEYAVYVHQLDEAKAFENLAHERVGSVRVIQEPTVPAEPKRLQSIIIIAGLILSIMSMFTVAVLTEFFSSGFLTPEKLERDLGLPVLAVVPFRK